MSVVVNEGQQQVLIPGWKILMFQLFTVLSYANSAVNPLLYVFVNENFRQNCIAAVSFASRSSQHPVAVATPTAAVRLRCGGMNGGRRTTAAAAAAASSSGGEMELQVIR